MKIFACHLLNDYSGSPKVLMQLVKGWTKKGLKVTIVTCKGRRGFLSDFPLVPTLNFWYKWSANPYLRLLNFLISQVLLFFKILIIASKKDIVYINTVLPFGAALAGKLKGVRVIYHIHETSVKPKILKTFLFGVVKLTAADVIFVSNYLGKQEQINSIKGHILHNAIENKFLYKALLVKHHEKLRNNVLMICSLKAYKGVFEFIRLAELNPGYNFRLVVNACQQEIDNFFADTSVSQNIEIYPTQSDTHAFYKWADIVLNLSRPNEWIETFGLTILEAMAYRLPVIIPPVGGITELVEENVNGFMVDCRDLEELSIKLNKILSSEPLYKKMGDNAFSQIMEFNEEEFVSKSISILKN